MQWQDEGLVLALRVHGEASVVLDLMTRTHGRHLGLLRSARRLRGAIQPGNTVSALWRGRLAEHLGTYQVEPLVTRTAALIEAGAGLTALRAMTALIQVSLPERDPHPEIYEAARVLVDCLNNPAIWPALYVRFELGLLEALGFGLDLSRCALTGESENLAFVSPRTGRAVSREAAAPYEARLLPLPAFVLGTQAGSATEAELVQGLTLTGHFLERSLLAPHGRRLPAARALLVEHFRAAVQLEAAPRAVL